MPRSKVKITKHFVDKLQYTTSGQDFYWDCELRGFDVVENEGNKFLKENEAQTAAITDILKLRDEGVSYKRIAKAVNENHKTKLSHMGVKRVLGRHPEK